MVRFGEREKEIAKEKFYAAKNLLKNWDVNADNIVTSKLVKTKTNSNYLIEHSDKAIRPLVSIMPKMRGYVKTFKVENKNLLTSVRNLNLLKQYTYTHRKELIMLFQKIVCFIGV